jgi:hypothetical protein
LLKFAETGKAVGNTGLPVGITGKLVPKSVNHFFKKNHFFLKNIKFTNRFIQRFSAGFRPVFESLVPPQTFFAVARVLKDLTPVCFHHHRPSFPTAADSVRTPALASSVKSSIFSRSIPPPPYFIARSRAQWSPVPFPVHAPSESAAFFLPLSFLDCGYEF